MKEYFSWLLGCHRIYILFLYPLFHGVNQICPNPAYVRLRFGSSQWVRVIFQLKSYSDWNSEFSAETSLTDFSKISAETLLRLPWEWDISWNSLIKWLTKYSPTFFCGVNKSQSDISFVWWNQWRKNFTEWNLNSWEWDLIQA